MNAAANTACCMRPRGEFRAEKSLQTVSSVGGSSPVLADVCPGSAPRVSTAGLAAPRTPDVSHTAGSICTAHPALPRAGVTDLPGATASNALELLVGKRGQARKVIFLHFYVYR